MINEVLNKLNGVKKSGSRYTAFCPAHDDRSNRSLSLTEREGTLLMHCFCGCAFGEIIDAIGLKKPTKETPQIEAIYDYTDSDSNLLYQVVRYYPKSFRQRRPSFTSPSHVKDEWEWNLNGVERVLFNLPWLVKAVEAGYRVYFTEGEKDALNLGQYVTTTTISGGASSKWMPQFSEVLHHAQVAIIPDDDTPGYKYATQIANNLYGWADDVRILNLGAKDVTEWLKTHNPEELETLWDSSKVYVPVGAVTREEFSSLKGHVIHIQDKLNERRALRKTYRF